MNNDERYQIRFIAGYSCSISYHLLLIYDDDDDDDDDDL